MHSRKNAYIMFDISRLRRKPNTVQLLGIYNASNPRMDMSTS